jgi:hypothetical protein
VGINKFGTVLKGGYSRPGFELKSAHVGFVVDKAALGQVSPNNSVSLTNHSTDCSTLIIIHHAEQVQEARVPSGYNLTPTNEMLINSIPVPFISKVLKFLKFILNITFG